MKNLIHQQYSRRSLVKKTATLGLAAVAGGNVLSSVALSPAVPVRRVVFVFIPGGALPGQFQPEGCGSNFALKPMSAPLEPIKQHCVFFNNLDMSRGGHGSPFFAMGGNYSPQRDSIDLALVPYLKQNTPFAQLTLLASGYPSTSPSISWGAEVGYTRALQEPIKAYQMLFGDAPATTKTVLDEQFARAEPAISDFESQATLHSQLAVLALQRNKTNIVSLMFGDDEAAFRMPREDFDYHHAMSSGSQHVYIRYRAYLSEKFAYLVKLLEATPDSNNKSLLDSTLVVGVTDMGCGADHSLSNAPFMLAGGKSFTRNGYLLNASAFTHDDFLDTVARLLGAPIARYGNGPILAAL